MRKICFILLAMVLSVCSFLVVGCTPTGEQDDTQKPSVYLDKTELEFYKGESQVVNVVSESKIDSMNIRWTFTESKIASVSQNGTEMTVSGKLYGETEIVFTLSGKEIGRVKVTVKEPELTLMLPNDKLVLRQGKTATVRAFYELSDGVTPVWMVESDKVTIESQGLIAKITVKESCPDGEYKAKLTCGDVSREFLIIVGV